MSNSLLIEVGVEELPAIPLLKILDNIETSWREILEAHGLKSDFEFLYTPRRLVLIHKDIPLTTDAKQIELFGPPVAIAIKDGTPTQAGASFATKCGVDFDKLETKEQKGKKVLYYKKSEEGKEVRQIIPVMIDSWIRSLAFGKMMRWGSSSDEFIRPIRWLQVRLNDEVVECELFGVHSGDYTYLHRIYSDRSKVVTKSSDFEEILKQGAVVLRGDKRRAIVLDDIKNIELTSGLNVEIDEDLLDEVVAITENPKALLGKFDESFLELPPEVIITSMKENQRYFPVFENGKLSNHFVVVSNALTDDYSQVVAGNERVLKPRLSDAMFFYRNDLKRGLTTDGLEKVTFMDGLGSVADKIDREGKIALFLARKYNLPEEQISQATKLAKADLTSEMVYEFIELQGLMGYYYAKAQRVDDAVAVAIKEQYMPVGEGAQLPSTPISSVVAMAIKLDTLIGLFSVGKIPTGSKDPFALRRAVNGIIRIVVANNFAFDIKNDIDELAKGYKAFDVTQLRDFIVERIYKSTKANPSVVNAVLASGEGNLREIFKKIDAVDDIVSNAQFKEISSTFKRVANISKDVVMLHVDTMLFEQDEEQKLFDAFDKITKKEYNSYDEKLSSLFALKPLLDSYFDNVMVNSDSQKVRENRLATIGRIYNEFRSIADLKEITA